MKLLSDEEIHDAVMVGFDKKVIADNLTDEIELKRHEAVKEAIRRQAELTAREIFKEIEAYVEHGEIYPLAILKALKERYGVK